MFKFKNKNIITKEILEEYNNLLHKWEYSWSLMSKKEIKRFLKLNKLIKLKK